MNFHRVSNALLCIDILMKGQAIQNRKLIENYAFGQK